MFAHRVAHYVVTERDIRNVNGFRMVGLDGLTAGCRGGPD